MHGRPQSFVPPHNNPPVTQRFHTLLKRLGEVAKSVGLLCTVLRFDHGIYAPPDEEMCAPSPRFKPRILYKRKPRCFFFPLLRCCVAFSQARKENQLETKCASLWTFLELHRPTFLSQFYQSVRSPCSSPTCAGYGRSALVTNGGVSAFAWLTTWNGSLSFWFLQSLPPPTPPPSFPS